MNNRDWDADPQFNYSATDKGKDGTKTYEVTMLYGSPYNRLLAINGHKLTGKKAKEEQKKYDGAQSFAGWWRREKHLIRTIVCTA